MSALKWSDPPQRKQNGANKVGKWSLVADELRANPNVWALVAEDVALSTAGALRTGAAAGFVKGDFEVRSVKGDGVIHRGSIYARFIGGAS